MARETFIKIRTSDEEKAAYVAVAQARGKDLSELMRAYLDRLVRQDNRKGAA